MLDQKVSVWVVLLLTGCVFVIVASNRNNEMIKFEDGQYTDIVIAIDGNKIPATECSNIVESLRVRNLKKYF